MAATFPVGSFVVNFGVVAMVVDLFATADGRPSVHDGHPILRAVSADARHFVGDKWLADPAHCVAVEGVPALYAPRPDARGTTWNGDGLCTRHGLTPNAAGQCNACAMTGGAR